MMLMGLFVATLGVFNVVSCAQVCECKSLTSYLQVLMISVIRIVSIGVILMAIDYFCDNKTLMVFMVCGLHRF